MKDQVLNQLTERWQPAIAISQSLKIPIQTVNFALSLLKRDGLAESEYKNLDGVSRNCWRKYAQSSTPKR